MKRIIKNNIKILIWVAIGVLLTGTVVYGTTSGYLYDSDEVSYSNQTSGLTATDVQSALDELKTRTTTLQNNYNTCNTNLSSCQTQLSNLSNQAKNYTSISTGQTNNTVQCPGSTYSDDKCGAPITIPANSFYSITFTVWKCESRDGQQCTSVSSMQNENNGGYFIGGLVQGSSSNQWSNNNNTVALNTLCALSRGGSSSASSRLPWSCTASGYTTTSITISPWAVSLGDYWTFHKVEGFYVS